MLTIACCSVVGIGLGLGLGLDLVSGRFAVMHTYLYYVPLSLSHCKWRQPSPPPLSEVVYFNHFDVSVMLRKLLDD